MPTGRPSTKPMHRIRVTHIPWGLTEQPEEERVLDDQHEHGRPAVPHRVGEEPTDQYAEQPVEQERAESAYQRRRRPVATLRDIWDTVGHVPLRHDHRA